MWAFWVLHSCHRAVVVWYLLLSFLPCGLTSSFGSLDFFFFFLQLSGLTVGHLSVLMFISSGLNLRNCRTPAMRWRSQIPLPSLSTVVRLYLFCFTTKLFFWICDTHAHFSPKYFDVTELVIPLLVIPLIMILLECKVKTRTLTLNIKAEMSFVQP